MMAREKVFWMFFVIFGTGVDCQKQKRQLFREQVLPALGGKIPEEAFRTDRLALNRLNKEGITVVDGVILEARQVDKHPTHVRSQPEILKVFATVDNRYTPPEGRHQISQPETVDTTYVIRSPAIDHIGKPVTFRESQQKLLNKQHGYRNFLRYTSPMVPRYVQHRIYKPSVTPLHVPAKEILYSTYYRPSWRIPVESNEFRPISPFYFDNAAFDTHQAFDHYNSVFHHYHHRRLRHSGNPPESNALSSALKSILFENHPKVEKSTLTSINRAKSIPATNFSCRDRKGTFADIQTNCQIFHQCTGWTMISSVCPVDTAYSNEMGRCEWAHQVKCN